MNRKCKYGLFVDVDFDCLFSFQQLFRSQQTQAATPSAAQLQLLQQQQQQYLAQQQQAAFPQAAPYLLNPQQEPYIIPAGVPQYYGVGPWVYPAPNLIQQGASNGARRPLTPNGTAEAQQQVQVSFFPTRILVGSVVFTNVNDLKFLL